MKLVQKILSHGLFIAFIVAAFFLYSNRTELFPQWFASSQASDSTVASRSEPALAQAPATTVTRPMPEKTLVKEPVTPAAPGQAVETAPVVEQRQGAEADASPVQAPESEPVDETSHAWSVPADGSDGQRIYRPLDEGQPAAEQQDAQQETEALTGAAVEAQQAPTAATGEQSPREEASTETPPAALAAEADSQAATAEAESPVATGEAGELDGTAHNAAESEVTGGGLQRQLEQARSLYWQQQHDDATSAYEALGRAYPDNADVWGEIGNFYYSLKQTGPASAAYSRAIELLVQQNEQGRARQLLGVLYRLDADRARDLEMRMQQAGG